MYPLIRLFKYDRKRERISCFIWFLSSVLPRWNSSKTLLSLIFCTWSKLQYVFYWALGCCIGCLWTLIWNMCLFRAIHHLFGLGDRYSYVLFLPQIFIITKNYVHSSLYIFIHGLNMPMGFFLSGITSHLISYLLVQTQDSS